MFYISKEDLFTILNKGDRVYLKYNDKMISLYTHAYFDMNEEETHLIKRLGYVLGYDDIYEYKDFEELISHLNKIGVSEKYCVYKINFFERLEDYKEDLLIRDGDINYILNKYNKCNIFSLSAKFNDCHIDKNTTNEIYVNTRKDIINNLKTLYDRHKIEIDFDELIENIENDCIRLSKIEDELYRFHDNIYQEMENGNTTYYEPKEFFYNFYERFASLFEIKKVLLQYQKFEQPADIYLDLPKELKKYVKKVELLFGNHVTFSYQLFINFYIELNDETKKWLLSYDNFYQFNYKLDDLALYIDDEIKFSSCTHERFYHDVDMQEF